jgi:hypothetical protein
VEILDGATCAVLDTVAVSFQPDMDQLVIVPASGSATSRAITLDDQAASMPKPSMDPNRCIGLADGLSVTVENRTSETYDLIARSASGDLVSHLLEVPGRGSGAIVGNGILSWGAVKGTTLMAAGAIDLVDPATCRILSTVEYPDYGAFVVSIDDGGRMAIADGPLPTGPSLPRKGFACVPGGTPLPSASPSGS